MTFNTTGRAAWIFAAALCASVAMVLPTREAAAQQAPEQAAVGSATGVTAAPSEPVRLHPKKSAEKSRKADRQAKAKKPAQPAQEDTAKDELKPTQDAAMTPAVANANAQWANDAKPTDTYNMSAQAGTVLSQMDAQPAPGPAATPSESAHVEQVIAADQLNDLDRAAESQPPLTLAKATIDTPPAAATTVENSSKPWEQTSMIGKVFIALGGLLTVASAARMFMA